MAPEIIPIELKLANDTRNTEVTPLACVEISDSLPNDCIATNSLESSFVAITEPDCTASFHGTPDRKAKGAKTKPIKVWKSQETAPCVMTLKRPLTIPSVSYTHL